jgi:hypothetical protein
MAGQTVSASVETSETSDLMLYASYGAPTWDGHERDVIDSVEHQFSPNFLFPDLREYSKVDISETNNFSSLSFGKTGIASLKLVETSSSFKNSLGHYQVSEDGAMHDVRIAFGNTRSKQAGATHNFNISSRNDVHLFVIANGFSLNKELSNFQNEGGEFSFLYKYGQADERLAKITDSAEDIDLIYKSEEGETSVMRGPVYHSTNDEEQSNLNPGGRSHTVSGRIDEDVDNVLRIGFEDFPGLGDADYNDVVLDFSVVYTKYPDGNEVVEALHEQVIEPQKIQGTIPLYERDDAEIFDFQKINGLQDGAFDVVFDDIEEIKVINIDDVIDLETDHNDEVIAQMLNMFDVEESLDVAHAINTKPSSAIIDFSAENNISGLEALVDII